MNAVVVVVAVFGLAGAVDIEPQVALWGELDSNPKRLPENAVPGSSASSADAAPDGLLRFAGSVVVDADAPGRVLRLDAALGGKLFMAASTERMLVAQARAVGASSFGDGFTLASTASGKLRGQLSGQRSYGSFRGDVAVDHGVLPGLSVRGGLEGGSFLAFDNALFSFAGGGLVLGARYSHDKERVDVVVDGAVRGFPFAPPVPGSVSDERRVDLPVVVGVTGTSARRLYLQVGYTLVRNDSNADGERYTRHRVQLNAGTRLPALVTVTTQLALQLTSYDDGVSAGQSYFIADDDETQNLAEITLQRPLFGGLIVEARLGLLSNELSSDSARFSRATAALGLRADL
ncbi:MAG: hypothetical protein Q8O67_11935 [Deltaproteobacteria bacterium]|nr:hypothetical protein [Deltaproteobacteria bacterium]